jgi:rhodanese-related sulfurtransferase
MTAQPTINVEQLKSRIAEGKITLLDVRRKADYEAAPATIPGAVWRDPEQVDQWRAEITGGAVLYCVRGGSVSQSVCQQLSEAGIDATYLEGGLAAWTGQGEAVK